MVIDTRPSIDLDIARFLLFGLDNIDGWGIDSVLARLFLDLNEYQRGRKVYGNLLEIGVHHGRTSVLLALMSCQGERSVFIDLFDRQSENIDQSGEGNRGIFDANLAKWAPGRSARVVQANSLELDFLSIEELVEGVRFSHIDGAHYPEAVLNDLNKTQSVLQQHGIVVVDDFMHTGFPGVNEACNFYLTTKGPGVLAPVAMGRNKLILTTPATREDLVEYMVKGLGIGSPAIFHGYEVLCLDLH